MNDTTTPTTNDRPWRALLAVGGLATFIGGGMHPEAPDGLSMGDDLAFMMNDDSWVPGHTLGTIGAALTLAGFVVLRRRGGWPALARLLPFAVVAAAVYVVEAITHTASVVDKDGLAQGDWGPVITAHIAVSVVAYPLFGAVTALLGWRLVRTWPVPLRPFAALGMVGGIAHVLAVLTIVLRDPGLSTFFPIGGIGTAIFYVVVGIAGARQVATRRQPVAAPAVV